MLKTQELVPEIYCNQSRDFQLLGRVYDIVFNYLKTNIDTIVNNPLSSSTDSTLLDLVVTTLGFKSLHNYNSDQLAAVASTFVKVLSQKGSLRSIETTINTILQVQNIKESCVLSLDADDKYILNIYVPAKFSDLNLLNDILNYILPAGMEYNLIRQNLSSSGSTSISYLNNSSSVEAKESCTTSYVPKSLTNGEILVAPSTYNIIGGSYDNAVVMPYQEDAESGEN